jgi:tRNA A-37 threonylcarbamoyl transferase component Bud32/predicted nucleotidyltransferase
MAAASLSPKERAILGRCVDRAARGRPVAAACVYGSKVAGYARPDSDVDLLVVLEGYRYKVKYAYMSESGAKVSALLVDRGALEKDADQASMGEFVAGRLLHVYEPLFNTEFFDRIERTYKRRVILEEAAQLVKAAGALATEISFPLEYVLFSKVKRRAALYPNAAYSYYKTYASSDTKEQNLQAAMAGYRRALADIVAEDPDLLVAGGEASGDIRISAGRVGERERKTGGKASGEEEQEEATLKLSRSQLRHYRSYLVHSYAGRQMFHLAMSEAESKIRRHLRQPVEFPPFMACPACEYLRLPEGLLVADSRRQDWLGMVAKRYGLDIQQQQQVARRRLGNPNSRTMLYSLAGGRLKLAVKDMSSAKSVKWAALGVWTAPVKKFRIAPLLRLGYEYRAIRHLRTLGLATPAVEVVALDRRVLVTRFVEGPSLASVIKGALRGSNAQQQQDLWPLRLAAAQMARVHLSGHAFGNIKPKNVIVSADGSKSLHFTDLDQFMFEGGDPAWDVAEFVSWGLKGTGNSAAAAKIVAEFLAGYGNNKDVVKKLAGSRRYVEAFYPVLAPTVAQAIKREIKKSCS